MSKGIYGTYVTPTKPIPWIKEINMEDGVAIVSGGLDSITMLYKLLFQDDKRPYALSFHYGQRHGIRELYAANKICNLLGVPHRVMDLTDFGRILADSGSSLVDYARSVPEGHYAASNMKSTVVPNRNMTMLSIAAAFCVSIDGKYVATGVHAGDHEIYPDCRPEFIMAMRHTLVIANHGFINPNFYVYTPFIHSTKADIASLAGTLDVPIEETWSCYNGRDKHCGRCGTCVERIEALHVAGVTDLTEYEDPEYWKTQVRV